MNTKKSITVRLDEVEWEILRRIAKGNLMSCQLLIRRLIRQLNSKLEKPYSWEAVKKMNIKECIEKLKKINNNYVNNDVMKEERNLKRKYNFNDCPGTLQKMQVEVNLRKIVWLIGGLNCVLFLLTFVEKKDKKYLQELIQNKTVYCTDICVEYLLKYLDKGKLKHKDITDYFFDENNEIREDHIKFFAWDLRK